MKQERGQIIYLMSTLLNNWSHLSWGTFKSQACVTFLSTWLILFIIIYKPFAFVFFFCWANVHQLYHKWTTFNQEIDIVTDGHYKQTLLIQTHRKMMWNWWSCPLSVFSFGYLWICSNFSLSLFYSNIPSLVVTCSILY